MRRTRSIVLLVEDNPDDAEALRISLSEAPEQITLVHCETLRDGLQRLESGGIDVVLLDLSLPDSQGHRTVQRTISSAPGVPVVVLTGLDDERVGSEAVQAGAQDYLVKGTLDTQALTRTIRYAIERHRMRQRQAAAAARWAALAEENACLADALGRSNELKTRFAATMSHELRSTLSAIINLTEILDDQKEERSKARHQEVVRLIRQTARESLQVLDATIELSRAESNHLPSPNREIALADIVSQVEQEVTSAQTATSPKLVWKIAGDLPLLRVDPVKVKMILRNLISNAIKFTPDGQVTTSAALRADRIELTVRDTGTGITEEDLAHLFEPFSQASAATRGGGLGLYIVRRLAEILGGTVAVESRPGEGSTFTVCLPIQDP